MNFTSYFECFLLSHYLVDMKNVFAGSRVIDEYINHKIFFLFSSLQYL